MSALKGKHYQKVFWLQPSGTLMPRTFKRDLLAYPTAKKAFNKTTSGGFPEDMLWSCLWGLAYLEKTGGKQNSAWYRLPGIPPHKLRRFPARIRQMAHEIEQVDTKVRSDQAYGLTVQFLPLFLAGAISGEKIELPVNDGVLRDVGKGILNVPASLARSMLHQQADLPRLAELPKAMRLYADFFEVVAKLTAYHAPKARATLTTMMRLELVDAVNKQSGNNLTPEIATLVEAAYFAVGTHKTVDPRNLKTQYRRRVLGKK